ncbi:MAG: SDR family oxidoreductase [Patescibacteria group bacterium]
MAKALVTGGAGFIGSHLVDALVARGDEVTVLDDLSTGKKANLAHIAVPITFIEGSVDDYDTVAKASKGVDTIFHLAAIASVQKSVEAPIVTHRVNTQGTLTVFEVAHRRGIPKVVYVSSSAVYGNLPELPKNESMPCCPKTPYALHKMIGEKYARMYHELHNLHTVGLRFFNVFGPRQDALSPYSGVISLFHKKIKAGEAITIFGDGETTRDFTFVSDAVSALLTAEEKGSAGSVYNIGTGHETSLNQLVDALEQVLGVSATAAHAPERIGDIKRSVADISKARTELGWEPQVEFNEGIQKLAS